MKKNILVIVIVIVIILIIGVIGTIGYIYSNKNIELINKEISSNITSLDIEVGAVDLVIKKGNSFKIETDNKYIKVQEKNSKLSISERDHITFFNNDQNNLIIYIPENYLFQNIKLEAGTGKLDIEELIVNSLELEFGAGKTIINNLIVNNYTEIDSGVGEVDILDGSLTNLDLESGVGKFSLNSKLIGNTKIEAGVGDINLNILGNINDYKIVTTTGIGNIKINGSTVTKTIYGNGNNNIVIEGGIGSININIPE